MRRLHELHARVAGKTDLMTALGEILATAAELAGTDRGCMQLVSDDGERLEMFAHRGYGPESGFIRHFLKAGSKPACDMARRDRQRLIIEDVATFPGLLGTKDREVALAEDIRATQSTPLFSRKGELVGVLSTQYRRPYRPSDHELRMLDLLAWTAAEFIERHQAEAALRESEARFRALVTAGSYLIYRMSPDWRWMYQLDGRGFLADTPEPIENWADRYIPPEDRPAVFAAIADAVRSGSLFELEHRVRRADAGLGWTLSRAVPMRGPEGEIVEWFGAASDMTPRRAAQERLRESEERFRSFAEASADVLWIMDAASSQLEYLSPAFEAMWGEPRDAVLADIGRWAELVHPEDRERALQGLPRLLRGEVESFVADYRIVRPSDGATRWIRDTGFLIRDPAGAVRRVGGIAQDVSESREAADRARASEERLRALVEGIPQMVWRAADGGEWTWSSPQWHAATGLSEEASRGHGWLAALHPDDREGAMAAWARADATGAFAADYRLRRLPEGRYRWFQTRAAPMLDPAGEVVEWLGTSTDVDDLRSLQERQRLLLAELQHRVRNTLGVVRSIARRTAVTSASVEEYAMHLDGRLNAFARTQSMVTRDPIAGVDLGVMVAEELLAHSAHEGERIRIDGPSVRFQAKAAETIGLAVHELATNAVKHGSLSVPNGRIEVTWRVEKGDGAAPARLRFSWKETGIRAPPIAPPRRGFGAELLERTLSYELKAKTQLAFEPNGLRCTIDLPLSSHVAIGFDGHD
jgi:PAS domain S-box-containing protein